MRGLENKNILITGASSGIGKATSIMLAQHNPRLILVAKDEEKLSRLAEELVNMFPIMPKPVRIPCDITDPAALTHLVNTCEEEYGNIDIFLNNAGWGVFGESDQSPAEDFVKVMEASLVDALLKQIENRIR